MKGFCYEKIMKKHCTAFRWLGLFFAIWGVLLMKRSRKRQAVLPYCIATSFIILGVLLVKPLRDEDRNEDEQIEDPVKDSLSHDDSTEE